MDGYALALADLHAGTDFVISQRITAGSPPQPLQSGTAARIFTGAQIPPGADSVIMQEEVQTLPDSRVRFSPQAQSRLQLGANIRQRGEDIQLGTVILQRGRKLLPQDLGLAASVGIAQLSVYRRLKVATFFTGDELVQPGVALSPGQIYNSNQYLLNALLQRLGCTLINLGIVPDDLAATTATLQRAAAEADLVMTSGGVSVGEEDHIKTALETLGEIGFWRVAIKPGKPIAFGRIGTTAVIGLPGNPVSVFATCNLLARPFILRMQGCTTVLPQRFQVKAQFVWPTAGKRREYVRVRLSANNAGELEATLYPNQGSGVLSSTSWADGLAEIREHSTIAIGDNISFYPFEGLLG
jgi:molybdopterin molybdotransferase